MCTSNRLSCRTAAWALAATLLAWLAIAALPAWAQEPGQTPAETLNPAAAQVDPSADEAAPPLKLDQLDGESQATLSAIGRRFGNANPKLTMMSIMMDLVGPDSDVAGLKNSLGEVSRVLAQSNCGEDLAAPPVPTGDALWDRYALEVDKRINALTPEEAQRWEQVAALPDEMLAVWEPDFGGDGRYWEMRYACALLGGEGRTYAAGFSVPADYLREAQKRGCASANTLLLLYREMVKEHDKLLEPLTTYQAVEDSLFHPYNPTMLPARPDFSAETLAKAADLHAQCEAEERALLDAAVFIGPDQAWTYYTRALYWFDLGEYDKGTADLEAGNAAPVNVYPRPFPFPQVVAGLSAPAPLGSAAVSGAVLLMGLNNPRPDFNLVKQLVNEAVVAANLDGQAAILDAWHHAACTWPGSMPDESITTTVARVLASTIYEFFIEDQQDMLSAEQFDTLERELRLREQLHETMLKEIYSLDPTGWVLVLGIAGGMRGAPVAMYLNSETQSQFTLDTAQPLLADLNQVHYPELALPEALRKYEPMSELELAVNTQGRRVGNHMEINAQHARGDYGWDNLVKAMQQASQAEPAEPQAAPPAP